MVREILVYIWYPRLSPFQVGHAALTLSDGTHISWWPSEKTEGKKSKKNPRDVGSLDEDIRLEGRRPDKIFEIRISRQNERTIRYWWIAFCDAGEKYHLTKMNCCHVVVNALKAGGFDFEPNEISVMTPKTVANLVARIGFRPRSSGESLISTIIFALDMLRTQITLYLLCYLVGLGLLDMDL